MDTLERHSLNPLVTLALTATVLIAPIASAQDAMQSTSVSVSSSSFPLTVPERVRFSGPVTVKTMAVADPNGEPNLEVFMDMSAVTGYGLNLLAPYTTKTQVHLTLPLTASQQVEFTFPFAQNWFLALIPQTRTGKANISLNVNTLTGAVTSASAVVVSLP